MNDPIALISTETPIITTHNYIIYEKEDHVNCRTYSVFDKELGEIVFRGTLQECFDEVIL